jgi:transcriptional regulatory protein RtcR
MPRRKTVLVGLLGTTLDKSAGHKRWSRWRPTISAVAQPDLVVDRLELLASEGSARMAKRVAADVQQVSPETEVLHVPVDMPDPWDFESVYGVLADYAARRAFDPEREDVLVHITTGSHVAQICLFLLTESRRLPGRLLQTGPDRDNPVQGRASIIDLDLSRYDRINTRFTTEQAEATSFLKDGIETRSPIFNRLIDRIELVAVRSPEPVLLLGPTGAGKSRLARRIFDLKKARRQVSGDFVETNCATLRGEHAMSTLFGHIKGAFTGAARDRPGLLKAADGGVLFLDELGELGLDEQAMLLRALEEKRYLPVGADRTVTSDFQLLAGTNKDLGAEVAAGRFRADLLARVDTWTFALPSLADRREDIEPNLDYELARHGRQTGRQVGMNTEARRRFLAFAHDPASTWDRNFRDLGAAVRRMATLAPSGRITVDEVRDEAERLRRAWAATRPKQGRGDDDAVLASVLPGVALDRFDRAQLAEVVRVCRAQPTLAAAGRALFAVSREQRSSRNDGDRLRKYLARFDLTFAGVQRAASG